MLNGSGDTHGDIADWGERKKINFVLTNRDISFLDFFERKRENKYASNTRERSRRSRIERRRC
jgi:hypothetical protein